MSDLPPPDLKDSTGRMRRLVIALLIGGAAAAAAFFIADRMAQPDALPGGMDHGSQARAYKFVYYVTGLVGAACFMIALGIQNVLAKRKWQHEQMPQAKIRQ